MEIRWRVTLFGELRTRADARLLTHFRRQKTGALLAYLAYYVHRSHLRDTLLDLLWPQTDLPTARNNLSIALSWLRQHLEPAGTPPGAVLLADRTSVRLNPDAITTDVAEFQAALQAAERTSSRSERRQQLERAVELYQGELLVGYYEEWLLQPREWLQERYFLALGQLTGLLAEAGEGQRAIEYGRRGVEVDPLREEAHRELMRLLATAGQPHAALRQYRELERVLKQELDSAPSAASRALAREISALAEQATVPELARLALRAC